MAASPGSIGQQKQMKGNSPNMNWAERLRILSSNRSLIMKGKAQASSDVWAKVVGGGVNSFKDSGEVKDVLINSYVEPLGWGCLGVLRMGRKQKGCRGWGGQDGGCWMELGGGGVRIMVVKMLFPPGEKKGVNDTLELLTTTRRSSLSFMEGERHTQPSRRWGGQGDSHAVPPPRSRDALTKRKEEEEELR